MTLTQDAIAWTTIEPAEPAGDWSHSGMGVLGDGRVVYAQLGGAGLVILDEATGERTLVPTPTADAHGIFVDRRGSDESLWIADPGPETGQLLHVELDGSVIDRVAQPGLVEGAPESWRPTSSAVVAVAGSHTGDLWVADGYGLSLVHRLRTGGDVLTIDGTAFGERFDCPHGIAIDDRGLVPLVAIADRSNRRVVFLDLDGTFVREVTDAIMTSPSSLAVRGNDLLVTDLFGAVLRIDRDDSVHAVVASTVSQDREGWPNRIVDGKVVAPELRDNQLNSPHGIAVAPGGEIYVAEWMLGGRVIRFTPRPDAS